MLHFNGVNELLMEPGDDLLDTLRIGPKPLRIDRAHLTIIVLQRMLQRVRHGIRNTAGVRVVGLPHSEFKYAHERGGISGRPFQDRIRHALVRAHDKQGLPFPGLCLSLLRGHFLPLHAFRLRVGVVAYVVHHLRIFNVVPVEWKILSLRRLVHHRFER